MRQVVIEYVVDLFGFFMQLHGRIMPTLEPRQAEVLNGNNALSIGNQRRTVPLGHLKILARNCH
jgi:hypothetical protein